MPDAGEIQDKDVHFFANCMALINPPNAANRLKNAGLIISEFFFINKLGYLN